MQIVIIGNSAAGLSCLETFRKYDQTSNVTIIAKEERRPYSRVLLPYYLRGKIPYENLFIRDESYYEQLHAQCIHAKVIELKAHKQVLLLDDGSNVHYDKLLIASGSSPVKPPIPGLSGNGVHHLWTLNDVNLLAPYFIKGNRVVVLGSGFVSLQGAWSALSRGLDVTVIELMDRIMPKALDEHGAKILARLMIKAGIDLRVDTLTTKIEKTTDKKYLLHFDGSRELNTDFIIVGTGVRPNIEFLKGTGITIDTGIIVNELMETNLSGVYAAGDVAQVPSFCGGPPVVHALWPTAVETGAIAGESMALQKNSYKGSLNMNVTQMFDTTIASMGEFIGGEETEDWIDTSLPVDQYLKIVLRDGVPVGATCVGSTELISTLGMLRPLIREKIQLKGNPEMLKAIMAQNISQHHQAFVK
ncbi:MAG: NAD(P)/FAD-dependent oxidoreductase [Desulforhopalus sp.]